MFTLKVDGLQAAVNKLNGKPKEVERFIQTKLNEFGLRTVADAVRLAPVDEGHLKNSIKPEIKKLEVRVVVAASYAAYVEFGTKKFAASYVATLPQDWQTFAREFKGGGGGTIDELIVRIMAWVKRKGFAAYTTKSGNRSKSKNSLQAEESAAYIIALRILQNGIKAHPFLYPAFEKNRVELIREITAASK